MKQPFKECEICVCTHEGHETLGCAAEKLRAALREMAENMPLVRNLVSAAMIPCRHYELSVYARRDRRMSEFAAILGWPAAERVCEMIKTEENPWGYDYEDKLWEYAAVLAASGAGLDRIIRELNWKIHIEE